MATPRHTIESVPVKHMCFFFRNSRPKWLILAPFFHHYHSWNEINYTTLTCKKKYSRPRNCIGNIPTLPNGTTFPCKVIGPSR